MELDVENAMDVVRPSLVLHNFLMMKKDGVYNPPGFPDAEEEQGSVRRGS